MDYPAGQPLTGGFITSSVTRSGNTVRRTAGPWSPAVHAWLAHLAQAGAGAAPRPVRLAPAAGIEEVTYIEGIALSGGASPGYLWRDDTLARLARLVRRFHDAAASFTPPAGAAWRQIAAFPGGGEVICHNDLAPWNTVFARERPVAFIDWDLAAPGPRWWDVSFAIWHFVPLYGDPATDPFGMAEFEPRGAGPGCSATPMACRTAASWWTRSSNASAPAAALMQAADAGDPAYQRLWDMGAGAGIQRQIGYLLAHRSACRTPSPEDRAGGQGPDRCRQLAPGSWAGQHLGTKPVTLRRSGRPP